jgi:hypothetical protein
MQRQKKNKEEMIAQEIEDYVIHIMILKTEFVVIFSNTSQDEVLWRILKIVFTLIIISEVRRLAMLGNIF